MTYTGVGHELNVNESAITLNKMSMAKPCAIGEVEMIESLPL